MNEYWHIAFTGLAVVTGALARYAVAGVEHRIVTLEKQNDDQAETIVGCQLEIAALKERTKRL